MRNGDHASAARPDRAARCAACSGSLKPNGILYLSWRVTDGADQRDPVGRLYTAFDGGLVRAALGGAVLLLDDEPVSLSSGKKIHRMVARKQAEA